MSITSIFIGQRTMKCLLPFVLLLAHQAHTQPRFHALAFYSERVEHDHVDFAHQAIKYYTAIAKRDHFDFASTSDWNDLNSANLARYDLVIWLNDQPRTAPQRASFEQYMNQGGGWLGFHIAAYNDSQTRWPWFVSFLGGSVFYGNEWPPLPADLIVEDKSHPIARHLPGKFLSPSNEWYAWQPSPRLDKNVKVLLSLSPSNYPIGLKDTLESGDIPVVWANTRFRMLYMNMGHGDRIFTNAKQNNIFRDAIVWLGRMPAKQVKPLP
jgi:type 1 glutamine amidotransferase